MPRWLDTFSVRNSEFDDSDGNSLAAGWLDISVSGDGDRFEIGGVYYVIISPADWKTETLKRAPRHIEDFIVDWLGVDLSRGNQSLVRQAYFRELAELDDPDARADDRGCFDYHQRAA